MEFSPRDACECAGLVLRQNEDFHFRFVVTCESHPVIQLIRRSHGQDQVLASQPVRAGRCSLRVTAHEQDYSFYYSTDDQWQVLVEHVDGRILSTPVAGGFVGAFLGMYASSNGQQSTNHADFDWFDYHDLTGF
jgi:alpha-N-arabinofuranosidase